MSYRVSSFLSKFIQRADVMVRDSSFNTRVDLGTSNSHLTSKSLLGLILVLFVTQFDIADAQNKKGWALKQGQLSETARPPELQRETATETATETLDLEEEVVAQDQAIENPVSDPLESEEVLDSDLEASNSDPELDLPSQAQASIPTRPVLDLSPDLRESLERQFKQIRTLLETEEAFSESLG